MSARRIRPRRAAVPVELLASDDPAFAAMDAVLIGMGWRRAKVAIFRRRCDGALSGRIVWRKDGRSVVWTAIRSSGERIVSLADSHDA